MQKGFIHHQRKLCLGLLTCALVFYLPLVAWAVRGNPNAILGQPSQVQYDVIIDYNVEIPLRDGVIVKADVHRPNADGKFPALMEGTPYGKKSSSEMGKGTHEFFVPRGYVVVTWESRGRYNSEGIFNPHVQEQNDCYDVVEWMAKQPWSNGKVASIGISYMGQVQLNTVISQPPHLTCAVPGLTAADLWREWYYRGGAMEYVFISSWSSLTLGPDLAKRNMSAEAAQEWMDNMALTKADKEASYSIIPAVDFEPCQIGDLNLLKGWGAHPADGPYWWKISARSYFKEMNVPMMHMGGWYDIFQPGSYTTFNEVQKQGASEMARDNQRLFMGPWHHLAPVKTKQGIIEFAPGLNVNDYHTARLEFLDYWMKDIQAKTFSLDDPVKIFVTGDNVWRTEKEWPLARTQYTKFYLDDDKSGTIKSLNDGTLSTRAPQTTDAPQSYVYNPMNPTPTRGGSTLYMFPYGPDGAAGAAAQDQRPVDKRSLTYTTDPLEKEMEVTGPVKAFINAASSAVDTDWVVRVSDVAPDGTAINIVDGIQRARFRTSGIHPTLIEPGKIYRYEVDLWATSHVFKAGHSIRVTVNSSSFPRWSRNMNVAELPEHASKWVKATNTIYLDSEHPSYVVLPVIPR